ncbi:MAG: hypothetical protein ABR538_13965 [Candidatus Binatia bacterium]
MFIPRAAVAVLLLFAAAPASGATFVVTNTNTSGAGSLHQAITDANATAAADVINFNIPSTPVLKTIGGNLPDITQPLVLDGYSQPGSARNTVPLGATNAALRIELDASALTVGEAALRITNGPTTIQGIAIKNIPVKAIGIEVSGDPTATIRGCFIGTDFSGNVDSSGGFGIVVEGSASIGSAAVGNRNLISGNNGSGVQLSGFGVSVVGNLIGTNAAGDAVLGNGTGILVASATGLSSIGGSGIDTQNVIAGNATNGIRVQAGVIGRVAIGANSIFDNGGIGIDLSPNGVTVNDAGDVDEGANGLQNFPVFTKARLSDSELAVEGELESHPGTYLLRFYVNQEPDPSGFGEGESEIGTAEVLIADGQTTAVFDEFFPVGVLPDVPLTLSATAQNTADGSTSEFAANIAIVEGGEEFVVTNTNDSGAGSLREAILFANGNPALDTILFDIPGAGPHVITPATFLSITAPVFIDGYSQPSSLPNTLGFGTDADLMIVLDGSALSPITKFILDVGAGEVVIRGLVVHGAPNTAVAINPSSGGSTGIRVEGCFIGTDAIGAQGLGNGGSGIVITGGTTGAVIGGPDPAQRNIVSASGGDGIRDDGFDTVILNNIVGGDATGDGDLGNADYGILLLESGATIGSEVQAAGNVIRANGLAGIGIAEGVGHEILVNSIADNEGLGIDIIDGDGGTPGVTANDTGDADGGANETQNFPVFDFEVSAPGSVDFFGGLDVPNGTVNATYTLRFYASPECDESGHGEGADFLGEADVVLSSEDGEKFNVNLPGTVAEGVAVTATATEAATGNTSEFSACAFEFFPPTNCGDPSLDGVISAADALATLRAAVGTVQCLLCRCDVNSAGGITATDALLVLRSAVGQAVTLTCVECA